MLKNIVKAKNDTWRRRCPNLHQICFDLCLKLFLYRNHRFVQVSLRQIAIKLVKRHLSIRLIFDFGSNYSNVCVAEFSKIWYERPMPGNWNSSDTLLEPFQAVRSLKMKLRSFAAFQRDTIQRRSALIMSASKGSDWHLHELRWSTQKGQYRPMLLLRVMDPGRFFQLLLHNCVFGRLMCEKIATNMALQWWWCFCCWSVRARSEPPHASQRICVLHAWFKTRTFQIYYNLYGAEQQLGTALVEPAPRIWIWIWIYVL